MIVAGAYGFAISAIIASAGSVLVDHPISATAALSSLFASVQWVGAVRASTMEDWPTWLPTVFWGVGLTIWISMGSALGNFQSFRILGVFVGALLAIEAIRIGRKARSA